MSKLNDAYNRLERFTRALAKTPDNLSNALGVAYDTTAGAHFFGEACDLFGDDIKRVLDAVEDAETYRELLHDLVTDESEKRAIGGGPNWRERHEKTWARAMELFEP